MQYQFIKHLVLLALLCAISALMPQGVYGQCFTPPDGLVGWWPGDGNFKDYVGTNNGIGMGNTTFATGLVGQAFEFDGSTNSFVDLGKSSAFNLSQFTVETWAFFDPNVLNNIINSANNHIFGSLLAMGSYWSCDGGFELFYENVNPSGVGNQISFQVAAACNRYSRADLDNAIFVAGWYHVVGTYDGNVARVYVNGNLAGTGLSCPGVGINSYPLRIGAGNGLEHDGWSDRFPGRIDEASLYNRALNSNEIAAIYAAGSAGKCKSQVSILPSNQVGYWGKSATFTASVMNLSPAAYQWFKDSLAISGATDATLVLTNLQSTNAGSYTVSVSSVGGNTINSAPANLSVSTASVNIALYSGVTIDGVVGQTYGVQATTNLSDAASWIGMTNITLNVTKQIWYDAQPAAEAQRYYRVVAGPISIP